MPVGAPHFYPAWNAGLSGGRCGRRSFRMRPGVLDSRIAERIERTEMRNIGPPIP
ncbi:MAG TPA: hypothetical protein VEQ15_06660 [Myxococcales bacterium]|nr:hypothetical protein [Myxococcales bacterium]